MSLADAPGRPSEEDARPGPVLTSRRPATAWTDALPVGNGRIGAVCFGGVLRDRVQVNDSTCWSGAPGSRASPIGGDGPHHLAQVRDALERGDQPAAHRAAALLQGGQAQTYQPLVDLLLEVVRADERTGEPPGGDGPPVVRRLDLRRAVAEHRWDGGVQQTFVSRPAGALVLSRHLVVPQDVRVRLVPAHPSGRVEARLDGLVAQVRMPCHLSAPDVRHVRRACYEHRAVTAVAAVRVESDGAVVAGPEGELLLLGASRLRLLLATETDARATGQRPALHGDATHLHQVVLDVLRRAAERTAEDLRAEHEADHRSLFDRVHLDLGPPPEATGPRAGDTPTAAPRSAACGAISTEEPGTDERLLALADGRPDDDLVALAFQYGRYLMIAGSRPGTEPLTLQGGCGTRAPARPGGRGTRRTSTRRCATGPP